MLYQLYQSQNDVLYPMRAMAQATQVMFGWPQRGAFTGFGRHLSATLEVLDSLQITHERPDYRIAEVVSGGETVAVLEEAALTTPFGTLLHFRKETAEPGPRVLVVAPLSGHFSTLLRYTVRTLLQDHDVYITDWHNSRDVPVRDGVFGFSDYVDTVISFLTRLGPGAHVVAVCQPCVQVLAAVALMSDAGHPCVPRSMTLMGGPIDVRKSPTAVNALAFDRPLSWFADNLITTVPRRYRGGGRAVYPGFMQLSAFMNMNMERHVRAHRRLFTHLARNEMKEAAAIKEFYDEYFAVLDMPAEFYLETVQTVFQEARLAKGELEHRGHKVDPSAIRRTALLTVEGERDDICGLGQTSAAHDLCSRLPLHKKRHHTQADVGHYGLFGGKKWETQIYPIVRDTIAAAG